ncbi:hypothetical protein GCM10007416_01780 [Kroppenstedtia guangzhouensis]|uniref:Uncharacterized protein n=1 Tax=Kroppenstedtia guangzhouensis TaxID=1274356 RepID=A0ABQ1FXW6_9BACL|nr:hypothetical protein GCM10007416_01780 [Kroppenstedtia guangzhouensis]
MWKVFVGRPCSWPLTIDRSSAIMIPTEEEPLIQSGEAGKGTCGETCALLADSGGECFFMGKEAQSDEFSKDHSG